MKVKNNFPSYLLKKKYNNHYLFSDSEIIMNKNFEKKIKIFSKENNGGKIHVEVIIPEYYEHLNLKSKMEYSLNADNVLDDFYNIEYIIEGSLFFVFNFDFIISDDTNSWELYCSSSEEIAILGCNDNLNKSVLDIINPYEEMSLSEKINSIREMFNNETDYAKFITNIKKNYNLR